jgi:hypothetical protein
MVLPYLVLKRAWLSAVSAVAFLAVALALPSIFYGFSGNLEVLGEWAAALSASTPLLLTSNDNVSVLAFFSKWTTNPTLTWALTGGVLASLGALLVAAIVQGRNAGGTAALEGAMLLVLIPLASPLGWDYTFLMSALAVTLLVNYFFRFPVPARIVLAANFAIIALALSDLLGRPAYSTFMQWSVTTVNFVVVMGYLAYLRFRGVC